ncbi:MAG: FAD:protein FMN transferase [Pseudomonadota bacterium]
MRLFVLFLSLGLVACDTHSPETRYSGQVMGTTWSATVVLPRGAEAADYGEGIQSTLDGVNALMSTYLEDSELSRFNQLDAAACLGVSADTREVIEASQTIAKRTGGAFDVTVGPLVNLWGFGPEQRPTRVPDETEIEQAMDRSGYQHLSIEGEQLCTDLPGLYVDLSAIAKGYAVDAAANYLQSEGVESFLVEVGGELYAAGRKMDGSHWRIGIEKPAAGERNVFRNAVVELEDQAIATSGDYRNFRQSGDGERYSHTIDPRDGRPISHTLASVTVIAPSAMLADGWATALMVLGPADGLKWAQKLEFPVYLLSKKDGDFQPAYNRAFAERYPALVEDTAKTVTASDEEATP